MIKEATANKAKYGVAGIGMQLKMLMWRAYIAKYQVSKLLKITIKIIF